MAVITPPFPGVAIHIKKKLKKSTMIWPLKPWKGAGAYLTIPAGIYKSWRRYGKITYWRTKLYEPTNNQLPNQQAWRAVYRDAYLAYRDLTSEQKMAYHKRAIGKHFSGYNIFMKEYLKSHLL